MRRCTSKITRAFPKPSAICERTSRFTIRSGFISRWTIKRQRRSIRADKTSFLEWLGFVLFSTKTCLDFWDHHTYYHIVIEGSIANTLDLKREHWTFSRLDTIPKPKELQKNGGVQQQVYAQTTPSQIVSSAKGRVL